MADRSTGKHSAGAHSAPKTRKREDLYEEELEEAAPAKRSVKSNKRGRKKKKNNTLAIVLVLVLLIIGAVALLGYMLFNHYYGLLNTGAKRTPVTTPQPTAAVVESQSPDVEVIETPEPTLEVEQYSNYVGGGNEDEDVSDLQFDENGVVNIVLVGIDTREDITVAKNDTTMMVSINRNAKQIVLTSFMRDMYVTVPGYWQDRFNTAFQTEGGKKVCETIEYNFKIKTNNYAAVDFLTFIDVVDAIGGLEMTLTEQEIDGMWLCIAEQNGVMGQPDTTDLLYPEDAGKPLQLNGNQVLAYARMRSTRDGYDLGTGDFDRTARQRRVIAMVIDKCKTLSLSEINNLAEIVLPKIETNLSKTAVAYLLFHAPQYMSYKIESIRIPCDDGMWMGMQEGVGSVIFVDFNKNNKYWSDCVYEGIYVPSTIYESVTIEDIGQDSQSTDSQG